LIPLTFPSPEARTQLQFPDSLYSVHLEFRLAEKLSYVSEQESLASVPEKLRLLFDFPLRRKRLGHVFTTLVSERDRI
jgi:hypothetical protein